MKRSRRSTMELCCSPCSEAIRNEVRSLNESAKLKKIFLCSGGTFVLSLRINYRGDVRKSWGWRYIIPFSICACVVPPASLTLRPETRSFERMETILQRVPVRRKRQRE